MPLPLMWSKIYILLVAFLTYTEMEKGSAAQAPAVLQTCLLQSTNWIEGQRYCAQIVIFKLQMTKTFQKTEKKLSYKKTGLITAWNSLLSFRYP